MSVICPTGLAGMAVVAGMAVDGMAGMAGVIQQAMSTNTTTLPVQMTAAAQPT